jgi:hypothetical protein
VALCVPANWIVSAPPRSTLALPSGRDRYGVVLECLNLVLVLWYT